MRTLAAVCGLLFLTSSYAETVALPDTPAATRLQQLIELMAEATPERVVNYVGNHYTPEYAQRLPLAKPDWLVHELASPGRHECSRGPQ